MLSSTVNTGKILTITLWEARKDMEATGSVANQMPSQAASIAGAAPPTEKVYEVTLQP